MAPATIPTTALNRFEVSQPRECLGGKALLRDITITSVDPRTGHPIHVVLVTPKDAIPRRSHTTWHRSAQKPETTKKTKNQRSRKREG